MGKQTETIADTTTEEVVETAPVVQPSPDASGPGAAAVVAAAAGAPEAVEEVPEAPVAPTPLTPLGERLHGWLYDNLAGGPLGRNTECWNAVHAAMPALEKIIGKE
jgi:hypothetical protein